MARPVHLIVYNSPLFPAHWALWVPSQANADKGKRIHVEGDAATGFTLSFDRHYDVTQEPRRHAVLLVDEVDPGHVVDDAPGDGSDREPRDALETVAAGVPPPGPSLVSAASRSRGAKVEIKNCQTWLVDVVRALHKEGIFGSRAVEVILTAPKN
ncbi:hypothetical protein F4802DRAFT_619611 [Xylaria palmicola]|nr:hypothetical protein F4802DRAFT_619611 [Xylaria palmicola]